MTMYDVLLDKFMQAYTAEQFHEEVEQAKAHFFEGTGFLDEESEDFEMKMMQFADWYVFNYPLSSFKKSPIFVSTDLKGFELSGEEAALVKNLQATRHSLFEFLKFNRKGDMQIRDIFSDYKLTLKNPPVRFGFNKGDIFEARLIPNDDTFCFTRAFSFHPEEAKKFILKHVKEIQKLPEDEIAEAREKFIFKIYKMKNKYEQYKHVAADKIYSDILTVRS